MNLVIFDIDGTLLRTFGLDGDCFARAFEREAGITGLDHDWNSYRSSTDAGLTMEIFQDHRGRPPRDREVAAIKQRFFKDLEISLRAEPAEGLRTAGVLELLDNLGHAPDWEIAIATGAWRRSALLKIEIAELGIAALPIATSDDASERTDIIRAAIARTRKGEASGYRRLVYVGDRPWDVMAAQQLGLSFLGVASGGGAERLKAAGATRIVADFSDKEQVLSHLRAA